MKLLESGGGSPDTLWAVVIGAFLATLGGFLATQFESWLGRRERRRGAALLFGDILSSLGELTRRAKDARAIGDPYGPITMRLMRAARREIDLYDRNREILYDLHDPKIRVRLHTLMVTLAMPLDSLFDVSAEITLQEDRVRGLKTGTVARKQGEQRLHDLCFVRDRAFDFIVEAAGQAQGMVTELGAHARMTFVPSKGAGRTPETMDAHFRRD